MQTSFYSTYEAVVSCHNQNMLRHHSSLADLYIDLLEQTLTGIILKDVGLTPGENAEGTAAFAAFDAHTRKFGMDWPLHAQTMTGLLRLQALRRCISIVLADNIPGDLIETGVWRGGTCIFMRAILAVYGDQQRRVWVADSFEGLPEPDAKNFPGDAGDKCHEMKFLAVPLEEVKENFAKFNMLDAQVVFLKGFFKDTLPSAQIDRLAILRLDGDMYESTIQALDALYHKLSIGGFILIDDYGLHNCKMAVDDFRSRNGIKTPFTSIDVTGIFWRKEE